MNDQLPWLVRMVEERHHRDTEGRPIREGRTPKDLLRPDEILFGQCPYGGSRYQNERPMNVSALRHTSAHWDDCIRGLAALQQGYARGRGTYGPDLRDIWYVSQLGSSLPWFYILSEDTAPPPWAAALAKATLGTGILAQFLIVKMLGERWHPPPITAQSLVEMAERSGTLVGPSEVCAAPDKMILRFCEVLCPTEPIALASPLGDRIDAALAFGAAYATYKVGVWLYFLARRFIYADAGLIEGLGGTAEPPDFFIVEPKDHKAVPPAARAAWLRQLGGLISPFVVGDAQLRDHALAIADAIGTHADPQHAWVELDRAFGDFASAVESSLQRATCILDRGSRDRLIANGPRLGFSS